MVAPLGVLMLPWGRRPLTIAGWSLLTMALLPGRPPAVEVTGPVTRFQVQGNRCESGRCAPFHRDLRGIRVPASPQRAFKGSWLLVGTPRLGTVPLSATVSVPPGRGDLLRAMTVGGSAPADQRALFRRLGITHLLAISGLHLGVVAMLVLLIVGLAARGLPERWGLDRPVLGAAVAIPAVWGYWHLTGEGLPTTRAAVMVTITLLLVRPLGIGTALTTLGITFALMAAVEPGFLQDPSFTLSFAAVLGILLATPLGGGRRGATLLLASWGATAATTLLGVYYFGILVPHALIVNLIVVPLFSLVILPLGILAHLTALWAPGPGGVLLIVPELLLRQVVDILWFIEAHLPRRPMPEAAVLTALVALLIFLFAHRPSWRRIPLGVMAVALLWLPPLKIMKEREAPRLTLFAFGESDTAVLEVGPRAAVVLDAGWPGLPGWLRRRGYRSLEAILLSHGHRDHYAAIPRLLAEFPVKRLLHSGRLPAHLLDLAASRGVRCGPAPRTFTLGRARFTVLSSTSRGFAQPHPHLSENDNSLVLMVELGGRVLIFPGDIEHAGEALLLANPHLPPRVDFLKIPHHGHEKSASGTLLDRLRPSVVYITGHRPAVPVLERLRRRKIRVLERGPATSLDLW